MSVLYKLLSFNTLVDLSYSLSILSVEEGRSKDRLEIIRDMRGHSPQHGGSCFRCLHNHRKQTVYKYLPTYCSSIVENSPCIDQIRAEGCTQLRTRGTKISRYIGCRENKIIFIFVNSIGIIKLIVIELDLS